MPSSTAWYTTLSLLDLALGSVQRAALTKLFVSAAAGSNLPNHLSAFMLWAFLYVGVTCVGING